MAQASNLLWIFKAFFIFAILIGYITQEGANASVVGLCNKTETYQVSRNEIRQGVINQIHYRYDWGKAKRVSFYRNDIAYHVVTVTSLAQRDVEVCCDGYKNISTSAGAYNCTPVCNPTCVNGDCIAPDNCKCRTPFTGAACNHVACSQATTCFPGACMPAATTVNCDCPAGFSGATAGAFGCRTMTQGPTLEQCIVTLSAGPGLENSTVKCSTSQPAYFNLASVVELQPNITVQYTDPAQLQRSPFVSLYKFGITRMTLTHSVNGTTTQGVPGAFSQTRQATSSILFSNVAQMQHGDKINLVVMAESGGYRLTTNFGNQTFFGHQETHSVDFVADLEPPIHCSQDAIPCLDPQVELQQVFAGSSVVSKFNTLLNFPGWSDHLSGILQYEYTVLEDDGTFITSGVWTPTMAQPGFARDPHKVYRVQLTVVDKAGNRKAAAEHSASRLRELKKPFNAALLGAFLAIAVLLILGFGTGCYLYYRQKGRAGTRNGGISIELGQPIEFKVNNQKNNKFADFRLCVVHAQRQRWSGVAKLLKEKATEEEKRTMIEKKEFWNDKKLHHRNVIKFLGSDASPQGPVLAFEFCEAGNLSDLLQQWNCEMVTRQRVEILQQIGTQVACGLKYLHSQDILHKKLMSRHVVLTQEAAGFGSKDDPHRFCAKVIGFDPVMSLGNKPMRWLAPEISLSHGRCNYTKASDVYNFAMFLFELMSLGDVPWTECRSHKEANNRAQQGELPEKPQHMEADMYQLMAQSAIKIMPAQRSSMEHIADSFDELYYKGIYQKTHQLGEDDVYYVSHNQLDQEAAEDNIYYNRFPDQYVAAPENIAIDERPPAHLAPPLPPRSASGAFNYSCEYD